MGDDPFSPGFLLFRLRRSLAGPQRQAPFARKGDNSVINDWTHSVSVEGRDFEDDLGRYRLFFDVSPVETNDEVHI